MCGAITIRPDWPFNSADENQISVESVSPAILQGISGDGKGCELTISASDFSFTNGIKLYPNPTVKEYTLDFGDELANEISTISVYDLMGKKIDSYSNPQRRFLNLEINDVPGTYFVVVQSKI